MIEFRDFLNYDPESGLFTWKIDRSRGVKAGDIAGSINKRGYVVLSILNKRYKAHRLAWFMTYGEWPEQIDHINQCKSDNRIVNLREANPAINAKNKGLYKSNKSGVNGVTWCKNTNKWKVQIRVKNELIYLGVFDDIEKAKQVRLQANIDYNFSNKHGITSSRRF